MFKFTAVGFFCFLALANGLAHASAPTGSLLTNKRVLENSVDLLSISSIIKPVVNRGAAIVIRNIEAEKTTDRKIIALIEDQMIIDLVSNGYVVLERDSNAIRRAIEEGGRAKYSILRGDMEFLDQTRNVDIHSKSGKDAVVLIKDPAVAEDSSKHLLLTHLKSADYILSYRVQELGINYEEIDGKNTKRSSVARLHIRIDEVASGKIVLARNIESSVLDSIPNDMIKTLAENRRSQFYQSYPGQNPDENNRYMQSAKRLYIQAAILNTFAYEVGGFGINPPMQIGVISGDERFGFELLSGNTEKTEQGQITQLPHSASMLVYAKRVGQVTEGTSIVAEVGLGNGSLSKFNAETKQGVGGKLGLGLEKQVYPKVDLALAGNIYLVKGNVLPLVTVSVRYRF